MTRTATRGDRLTDLETDTLALYADGHTAREIATQLGVTISTIASRVVRARTKLGARTIPQAIVLAYRTGQLALAAPKTSAGPVRPGPAPAQPR
ncbi:response regulator transcription factor [Kitasatospora sp. NPDC094028]